MRIYLITNSVNGKRYVGQTTRSIQHRFKQHMSLFGACRVLGNAIRKHGAAAFSIQEIDAAQSQADLDERERLWINRLNTLRPNGYNLMVGGNGGAMHPETRERIRIANTGNRPSLATRAKLRLSHIGKRPTDETRKKMSASLTGRTPSTETREKLRLAGMGHQVSRETREKIARALTGKRLSAETKQKISNTNAGRKLAPPMTAETRAKIGAASSRRIISNETREKLSLISKTRKNTLGRFWVNNGIVGTLCKPDQIDNYLQAGWSRGKGSQRKNGAENG